MCEIMQALNVSSHYAIAGVDSFACLQYLCYKNTN